jgi:hypothetical protein
VEVADEDDRRMVKKIRHATQEQELGAIHKQMAIDRQETVVTRAETMEILRKKCEYGASDSHKRWVQEIFQNDAMSMYHYVASGVGGTVQKSIDNGPVFTDDMTPVSISKDILDRKGLGGTDSNIIAQKVGVIAKRMYFDKYDQYPPKEWANIKGFDLEVNKYCKRDLPILEDAFNEYDENTRIVESRRIAKEKKAQEKAQEKLDKQQKKADMQAEKEAQRRRKSGLGANQGTIQFKQGN